MRPHRPLLQPETRFESHTPVLKSRKRVTNRAGLALFAWANCPSRDEFVARMLPTSTPILAPIGTRNLVGMRSTASLSLCERSGTEWNPSLPGPWEASLLFRSGMGTHELNVQPFVAYATKGCPGDRRRSWVGV